MQLIIADWRLAIEHVPAKRTAIKNNSETRLEQDARRAHMLQKVENERRSAHDRLMLAGGRIQL